MDKQQSAIMLEIKELVKSDQKVTEAIGIACSIPGVGLLTAATILAETSGFDLINSRRQLTSFAGLDVKEKQVWDINKRKTQNIKVWKPIFEKSHAYAITINH